MIESSEVERAERLGRSRARLFAAQALLFVTWQATFLSGAAEDPMRTSIVKIAIWFVWVLALLLLLATGGGLLRNRRLRGLLNDELTRRNRAAALAAGFWGAAVTAVALNLVDLFEPVSGREAVHAILSVAIAAALLTFSWREGRGSA